MVQLKDKAFEIFIPQQELEVRIESLAGQINQDYDNKCPLFVVVLNGAFMFAAELLKNITIDCEITFIKVSSYQALTSSEKITELIGLKERLNGRDIIILEDIVDSGLTIEGIQQNITLQHPLSLQIATLLFKPDALRKNIELKYVGFEIPNAFVVGFGLDYNGLGRNLKDLYILKEI
jgi:hypoxanthine phosphoribosyltransferase